MSQSYGRPDLPSRFSASSNNANSRFSNWSYHDYRSLFNLFRKQPHPLRVEEDEEEGGVEMKETGLEVEISNGPWSWSLCKKSIHMIIPLSLAFICTLAATIITVPGQTIHEDIHGPSAFMQLPYAFYILGMGIGGLSGAAFVELFQRRLSLSVNVILFAISLPIPGLSQSSVLLICLRVVAGVSAGTILTLGLAIVTDLWSQKRRTTPTILFFAGYFTGPTVGPLLGGILANTGKLSWRWVQLLLTFASIPMLVAIYYSHETSIPSLASGNKITTKALLFTNRVLGRPFFLLFTQPSIGSLSLASGLSLAVSYSLYISLPQLFETTYNLSWLRQSLTLLAIALGVLLGALVFLLQHKNVYTSLEGYWNESNTATGEGGEDHVFPARYRLIPALPLVALSPLSLVFFAFTMLPLSSFFIPLSFVLLFGTCNFLLFVSSVLYLQDRFAAENRESAVAAFWLMAHAMAAGLPIVFESMLAKLSSKGTFGVLAVGTLILSSPVIIFWVTGKKKGRI